MSSARHGVFITEVPTKPRMPVSYHITVSKSASDFKDGSRAATWEQLLRQATKWSDLQTWTITWVQLRGSH